MDPYLQLLGRLAPLKGQRLIIAVKAPDLEEENNVVEFPLDPDQAIAFYEEIEQLIYDHPSFE